MVTLHLVTHNPRVAQCIDPASPLALPSVFPWHPRSSPHCIRPAILHCQSHSEDKAKAKLLQRNAGRKQGERMADTWLFLLLHHEIERRRESVWRTHCDVRRDGTARGWGECLAKVRRDLRTTERMHGEGNEGQERREGESLGQADGGAPPKVTTLRRARGWMCGNWDLCARRFPPLCPKQNAWVNPEPSLGACP